MVKQRKNRDLITRQNVTPAQIKRLTKKALKNSFKNTPSKGCVYLKDLPIGSLFQIESGPTRGVLISCEHDAYVIITKSENSEEITKV